MRTPPRDKKIVEYWVRLYNHVSGATYQVTAWPDQDSSKQNVDALCEDQRGCKLAIEHTLIEAFPNEKSDADRFLKTLGTLENDHALCHLGYQFHVSLKIGDIPSGVKWSAIAAGLRHELIAKLPDLSEGVSTVPINLDRASLVLLVDKMKIAPTEMGQFLTGRYGPFKTGREPIRYALEQKVPKLEATVANKRILLLENNVIFSTVVDQYRAVCVQSEVISLRNRIDEIWAVETAGLEHNEHVIFTNPINPAEYENQFCFSLNVETNAFCRIN